MSLPTDLVYAAAQAEVAAFKQDIDRQNAARKEAYREFWRLYKGEHWQDEEEDSIRPTAVFNKVFMFVNKSLSFLIGKPATINYLDSAQEALLAPFVQRIIKNSGGMLAFTFEASQMASVTGDVFLKVIWDSKLKCSRIQILDSGDVDVRYSFIGYDNNIPDECRISWKFIGSDGNLHIKTEVWTSHSVETYVDDEIVPEFSGGNILGAVPVIHIRNLAVGKEVYGLSDVKHLESLNKLLNSAVRRFIDNAETNANPILAIFGARLKTIERAVGKVWGNLPKDAKVEYVGKDLEFPSLQKMIEFLDDGLYTTGGIPKATLTGEMSISNTSGVALYMLLLPLIELTDRKKLTYGPGFSNAVKIALELQYNMEKRYKAIESLDPDTQIELYNHFDEFQYSGILEARDQISATLKNHENTSLRFREWNEVEFAFADYLPKDQLIQRQLIREDLSMGLDSRKNAMKQLGKDNIESIMADIEANMQYYREFILGNKDAYNSDGTVKNKTQGMRDVTETAKGAANAIKGGQ